MSMNSEQKLTSLVNASGFLLQMGLEHQIVSTKNDHNWTIVSHEHPWRYDENEGFIDLVLQSGIILAVIECKRPRDGTWVFLVPEEQSSNVSRLRCLWVAGRDDGASVVGWDDLNCVPESYESEFCVIRGSGEGDRPLLERLCAMLLTSIDGLAEEELSILRKEPHGYEGFYLPLIVVTAELQVCRFRLQNINLKTGEVKKPGFKSVPFIRFRKAFSTEQPPNASPKGLPEAAVGRQRSVIVVNAASLVTLLTQFAEAAGCRCPYPWQTAFQDSGIRNKQ